MGAKTWMLVYADGNPREILKANPRLDRDATARLARELYPSEKLKPLNDGDLSFTCPPDDELHMGCFPGLSVLAAKEFGIDYPARLPSTFLEKGQGQTIYLHAMHSVVDWLAFAIWSNGKLQRSLSLSPDSGILEDIGPRLPFEEPYWSGQHPLFDTPEEASQYPFPFHPLDLGEAALREFFGYQLEGWVDPTLLEAETIPLVRFKRSRPWWKYW
jgi:hypothetical protein